MERDEKYHTLIIVVIAYVIVHARRILTGYAIDHKITP